MEMENLGLYHCPQCHRDCGDARNLFRHVETVNAELQATCLELMGKQMEEFRAEYTNRRRKLGRKRVTLPQVTS